MMAITYEQFESWYNEQWFEGSIAEEFITVPQTGLRCRFWEYWAESSGYLPFMTTWDYRQHSALLASFSNGRVIPTPFIEAYPDDIPF